MVIWTPRARSNLKAIHDHIAEDAHAPMNAWRVVKAIAEKADTRKNGQHYLVVVHTYRSQGNDNTINIPIISARPATRHEIRQYEG